MCSTLSPPCSRFHSLSVSTSESSSRIYGLLQEYKGCDTVVTERVEDILGIYSDPPTPLVSPSLSVSTWSLHADDAFKEQVSTLANDIENAITDLHHAEYSPGMCLKQLDVRKALKTLRSNSNFNPLLLQRIVGNACDLLCIDSNGTDMVVALFSRLYRQIDDQILRQTNDLTMFVKLYTSRESDIVDIVTTIVEYMAYHEIELYPDNKVVFWNAIHIGVDDGYTLRTNAFIADRVCQQILHCTNCKTS